MKNKHTFAICAYKESEFLEECIQSLKKQTLKSDILLVTSTPNEYISNLAQKYEIPVYVNEGEAGIVQDWNYAYKKADTDFVTITHQDDVYFENYAEHAVRGLEKARKPLIFFTDYAELRDGKRVTDNKLLKIKRMLLLPLRVKSFQKSRFIRRRILSLGSPICCPSVAFARKNLPETVFKPGFASDEDWEAWEFLSRFKGEFVYDKEILMGHRIHEESETSKILGNNARSKEDYIMFCKFWPKKIAKILTKWYSASEKSNELS